MAGVNPYMKGKKTQLPAKKYRLRFLPEGREIEVDPAVLSAQGTGQPGSVLDLAMTHDIDIDHACGGVSACSTCHVIVRAGMESCNESSEEEDDQLEKAPGLTGQSRLACQCVPDGSSELVIVEIPKWNRNLVREGG
jgi:2Fe-2S ferredoxin